MQNQDTRESLMREMLTTLYMHSRTMQTLLASKRYFAIIEPILAKYGVPNDFKYLCMAESGLNPEARSGAGAGGLWQLMPAYAKSAGLLVGDEVDERYHIEKSTEAACRYLIDAKRRLGSWTLAAAAFNAGVAGVSRRLEKQGVESYYDLFLPNETLRYVFRVLSFKLLMSDPAAYGYQIDKKEYYPLLPAYEEVTIDDPEIDWAAFAREHGTHYKQIRQLNPWIRSIAFEETYRQPRYPAPSLRLVKEWLDDLIEQGIADPERIYIGGYSLGGFGTWDAIQRWPNYFAGALPICGGGSVQEDPVKHAATTSIWVFHGSADGAVPVACSRRMVAALTKIGMTPLYTEYNGEGHEVWGHVFRDSAVWRWLFRQRRGKPMAATPDSEDDGFMDAFLQQLKAYVTPS